MLGSDAKEDVSHIVTHKVKTLEDSLQYLVQCSRLKCGNWIVAGMTLSVTLVNGFSGSTLLISEVR